MHQAPTPDQLQARLDAVLQENRRLRAETNRIVAESRAWSDAVARNIHEAPRWIWTNSPPHHVDSDAKWPSR